jgi:predicted acetylornithine/succinylornithine family transaminase
MSTETAAGEQRDLATEIIEREKRYLIQNYGRYPLALARGKGCYLFDFAGKRYLDLITGIGVNALGHGHPRILRVLREQSAKMIHCSNLYYHEYQGMLAERISRASGLARSFFCNSGTEAMEAALKMIRSHGNHAAPGKTEIISFENSFHGRTMGAISVTGQPKYRKDFEPLIPGVKFVPFNNPEALEAAVDNKTAGIVMEVIQGEGGVYPISAAMARKTRELADRHNALLVFDEIQCGVGRSGKFFAYQAFDPLVLPDIMVTAKPLAVGLPLGIVVANEKAAASLAAGMHGSTFGGGALACRVGVEVFDILEELLPQIQTRGEYFRHRLQGLADNYEFIKEVRVFGLMIGVELRMPGKQLVIDAMQAGMLINCTHDVVLRMLPPFIITEKEIDKAIAGLGKVMKKGLGYWKEFQTKPAQA